MADVQPHRSKNPRRCDECRQPAKWIVKVPGLKPRYLCSFHGQPKHRR